MPRHAIALVAPVQSKMGSGGGSRGVSMGIEKICYNFQENGSSMCCGIGVACCCCLPPCGSVCICYGFALGVMGKRNAKKLHSCCMPGGGGGDGKLMLDDLSEAESDSGVDDDEGDYECPAYWQNNIGTADFDDRVDEMPRVVKQVQKLFDTTFKDIVTRDRKGPVPTGLSVLQVSRIEDRKMWCQYQRTKRGIRQNRGSITRVPGVKTCDINIQLKTAGMDIDMEDNEFFLFHGTSPEGAMSISEDGFRLDLSGSNAGSMFGKGAYFAECCSKSDEYAKEGSGAFRGIYAMLLCRVVCGEMFTMLQRNDKEVKEAMLSGKYDAVLGDREASRNTYREFVVFRERQIYPEYVVLYKRTTAGGDDDDDTDSSG